MESTKGKIRKITAEWWTKEWYFKYNKLVIELEGGSICLTLDAELDVDHSQQLRFIVEIPCLPLPNTNPNDSSNSLSSAIPVPEKPEA
jgi:hypothetical protein